jgi:hypothetical protein
MPAITNDTTISHTSRNGSTFVSETADLRKGVVVDVSGFNFDAPQGALAADAAEFGAWHALNIHPHLLGGFSGYDCVTFRYLPKEG